MKPLKMKSCLGRSTYRGCRVLATGSTVSRRRHRPKPTHSESHSGSADAGSMITADLPVACFTERYSAWHYKAHFRAAPSIAYNAEPCPDSDGSLSHSSDSIMIFFA